MEHNSPNPFTIITPEELSAEQAIALFVDGLPGWSVIERPVNTLIYGFRGSGKSMALRYMEPDCQIKIHSTSYLDLPYFSVYIPIRHGDFYISEIEALKNSDSYSIRFLESYFLTKILSRLLSQFRKSDLLSHMDELHSVEMADFHNNKLRILLENNLWEGNYSDVSNETNSNIIRKIEDIFDSIHTENTRFLNSIIMKRQYAVELPCLLTFANFFLPFLKAFKSVNAIPNCPIYIFLDDIEEADHEFFRVLNTWMAARSNQEVCFKCTLVKNYKTRRTISGSRITHPHDYLNVNISDIFSSDHQKGYKGRLEKIVRKRLELHGLQKDPNIFFPTDKQQDQKLMRIRDRLAKEYEVKGSNPRQKRDGMYRYTRPELFRESDQIPNAIEPYLKPELIKTLGGKSKNRSTYRYCGFDEISNISGGVVRYFLESAAAMYGEQYKLDSKTKNFKNVKRIEPRIQHLALTEISEKIVFEDLWVPQDSEYVDESDDSYEINRRLRNLVHSIGGMCFLCLISDRSERRVFSFAVSDEISRDQRMVISAGLEKEYFYQSSIGNKNGIGRSELFVLTRRVSPSFHLDPLNFAAYKWLTSDQLELAMTNVNGFINGFRKRLKQEVEIEEVSSLPLWSKEQ
ncbi:MAG: hypothetical protein ABJO52_20950 [Nisaea sp.]|uniref:ORC-CDC6 family AAA ATPase n=1 Tax=Nisaea sp. TaxID=2024842 RepID=UPI0032989F94